MKSFLVLVFLKAALTNTGIPKVDVGAGASPDEQPEVNISDEEFLQFDTSAVPVIITLTKVSTHFILSRNDLFIVVDFCMWNDCRWGRNTSWMPRLKKSHK